MRINFRLEREEYLEASQQLHEKRRHPSTWASFVFAILLCLAASRATNARIERIYFILAIAVLAFIPCENWLNKMSLRRALKRGTGEDAPELAADITDAGIRWIRGTASTTEDWSQFSKYSESRNLFILFKSNLIHAIFPKRAFDSSGINSFRAFLTSKLPKF